jgi:hypothetical protein
MLEDFAKLKSQCRLKTILLNGISLKYECGNCVQMNVLGSLSLNQQDRGGLDTGARQKRRAEVGT